MQVRCTGYLSHPLQPPPSSAGISLYFFNKKSFTGFCQCHPPPCLVLWCFVLNPHRRSPYPNSQLELRDNLRVSSPATYKGLAESCYFPPFSFFCSSPLPPYAPLRSHGQILSVPFFPLKDPRANCLPMLGEINRGEVFAYVGRNQQGYLAHKKTPTPLGPP